MLKCDTCVTALQTCQLLIAKNICICGAELKFCGSSFHAVMKATKPKH